MAASEPVAGAGASSTDGRPAPHEERACARVANSVRQNRAYEMVLAGRFPTSQA